MKTSIYLILIIIFNSCANKPKNDAIKVNDPKDLNDQAIELISSNNSNSYGIALNLLNEATEIKPDYYLAYKNKLVILTKLELTEKLIENLNTMAKLQPNNLDNLAALGLVYELNGDSLTAMKKYQAANKLYVSILDTLTVQYDPQFSIATNRALNLKYLYKETEANALLLELKDKLKEPYMKDLITSFIKMDRNELINRLKHQ